MAVITIMNHGTANSTDLSTSEGCVLVITQIARMVAGAEGTDWILNEGAGTKKLRDKGVTSPTLAGIAKGEGVEENVNRSVAFVQSRFLALHGNITVNLVGHSRGSITCYKTARALRDERLTANVPVNVFAIDPVPGNTGTMNEENYKNIALGGNLRNSFLMLAESEHRLVFRPYVDALYSIGLPTHKVDTIPGTHGGINMLDGPEKEAASIVLGRALKFLQKNGTAFEAGATYFMLDGQKRLEKYSALMSRIKKYKSHATVNPLRGGALNFAMSGFQVERHRVANVYGSKEQWGNGNPSVLAGADQGAGLRGREGHHGLNMSEAIGRMNQGDGDDKAHATRPHRYFANLDHQELFQKHRPGLYQIVRDLEKSGVGSGRKAQLGQDLAAGAGDMNNMSQTERDYFQRFLRKRGL